MPIASMIFVSSWPARPTNGSPCRSSSSPGASPTNINRACGLPTPNTTWRRPSVCSLQRVQAGPIVVAQRRQRLGRRRRHRSAPSSPPRRRSSAAASLPSPPSPRPASAPAARRLDAGAPLGVAAHALRRRVRAGTRGAPPVRRDASAAPPAPARRPAGASSRSRMRAATAALVMSGSVSRPSIVEERDDVGVDLEAGAGLRPRRWRR